MKLANFMALPKFMKRLNFKDKRLWLVVLFIVLVIILFMRSNMTDGFIAPPMPPKEVTLTSLDNAIRVDWYVPEIDTRSPVTGFRVYYKDTRNPESLRSIEITDPSTRSTTISDLRNGTEISVKVTTRNAVGESGGSAAPPITVGKVLPPSNKVVQDLPPDQALNQELTWPPGPIWANIGPSSGNKPLVYTCPPELVNIPHPNNDVITFNTRRLPNGQTFRQCVGGRTILPNQKVGPYWKTDIVYDARLSPPTPLTYTVGNGSITISWDAPPGNLPVNVYAIRVSQGVTDKSEGKSAGALNGNAKSRSAKIPNLKNGVSYHIRVTAVDKNGSELFQYLPLNNIIPKA